MDHRTNKEVTKRIRVYGIVQGVGFRPLVYHIAVQLGIKGTVCNVGGYVEIMAQSGETVLDEFLAVLKENKEQRYEITGLEAEEFSCGKFDGFTIIESKEAEAVSVIPPDLPVCPECMRELSDPEDRRYGNPFISCMSCGPRYTVMEELPYDRDRTSMRDFKMCGTCKMEYTSPDSRRFHAQTISCNDCGPYLIYRDNTGESREELLEREAFEKACQVIEAGGIAAVKGIGGYHLVCSPFKEETVDRLRKLKGREEKPFAVMFHSVSQIREHCLVSEEEQALLESRARPIVLLSMGQDLMAPSTNKGSMYCGAFLPYTPLQILLTERLGPLIMTSANISSQPVIREDEKMAALSSPYLDGILYNKRRIVRSVDDSVARILDGKPQLTRRSRGYVPYPVFLSRGGERTETPVFAAGGDLKAAFCFYQRGNAVVSQYFGDLEEHTVMREYEKSYEDLTRLLKVKPGLAVCDLHPNYHSARFAEALGMPVLKVQHHHAHIASVMAEHGLEERIIGVAFDGTGYGTDGNIWGGEFLVCEGRDFIRGAHISYFPILGGDRSMRDARKTASCCLLHGGLGGFVRDERKDIIKAALDHRINCILTSSVGRLFDGASSVLNIAQENRYEGECGGLLEKAAVAAKKNYVKPANLTFPLVEKEDGLELDPMPFFAEACRRVEKEDSGSLALGFHYGLAQAVLKVCCRLGDRYGCRAVALSGGVFQNGLLTERTISLLRENGFRVYLNRAVPPNDGGISLGQVYLGREYLKETPSGYTFMP